jgi:hypothetical protein
MRFTLAAIAFILVAPAEARAQSKVTGKWLVRYTHEVRSGHMETGASSIVVDTVHVTLRQKGDSILGEWQGIAAAGETPRVPKSLIGIVRGDTARLEVDPNVTTTEGYFSELGRELVEFLKEHVHGIPPMTTKLELTTRGDSLVGSRWSSSADGATTTTRSTLIGVREKP